MELWTSQVMVSGGINVVSIVLGLRISGVEQRGNNVNLSWRSLSLRLRHFQKGTSRPSRLLVTVAISETAG